MKPTSEVAVRTQDAPAAPSAGAGPTVSAEVRRSCLRDGLLAGLACLAVAGGALVVVYREAHAAMVGEVRRRLENLAAAGAEGMDADRHAGISTPEQMGTPEYRRAVEPLLRLRAAVPEIFYAYTAVVRGDSVVFGLDTSFYLKNAGDETSVAQVGELYGEAPPELRVAWTRGRAVSSAETYTDKWGTFLSGFAPFRDESGRVAGVVGVDLSLADFQERLRPLHWSLAAAAGLSVCGAAAAGAARHRSQLKHARAAADLMRTREEAEAAARLAEAASRAKGVFLATMSHEIRTPMNGVLGRAELLDDTRLDDLQREHVKTIRESGEALLTVLNDILDYSKIEAGAMSIRTASCPLRESLDQAAALFSPQARAKGVELRVERTEASPSTVSADAGRLRQILANLVSNAVKFTERGTVRVWAEPADLDGRPGVAILVADTGAGIPPERMAFLFRPFFQVDDSTTRQQGGTGLGLAISRRLAELMGGRLTVTSRPGEGSVFRLLLPAVSGQEPPAPPTAPAEIAPTSAGVRPLRLLVAEDVPNNRRVVDLLLRRLGEAPEFANDGAEAVKRWRELRPEVILMDVQMPVMDGREAARTIRAEGGGPARPWIIALTAGALPEEREASLGAGMNDFITKPVSGEMLAAALRRARAALAAG